MLILTKWELGTRHWCATPRNVMLGILLGLAVLALGAELVLLLPSALERWQPYDYGIYVEFGRAVRHGLEPRGPGGAYPLPSVLWVFVPLSLMPDWFKLVWIIVPFIFILFLFRSQGPLLFLFPPLWLALGQGSLETWLLIPLAWLLRNQSILAGLGAVLLLIKPQLAFLAIVYMFFNWLKHRDWKNLTTFVLGSAVFCLPAFIVDPMWIPHFVDTLPIRFGEASGLIPIVQATVWAWWRVGGWGIAVLAMCLIVIGVLLVRAIRYGKHRAAAFEMLNLLLMPVLYAPNLIMALVALRTRREITALVFIAFLAWALDIAVGSFGGGYVLIPLAVMYFLARDACTAEPAKP